MTFHHSRGPLVRGSSTVASSSSASSSAPNGRVGGRRAAWRMRRAFIVSKRDLACAVSADIRRGPSRPAPPQRNKHGQAGERMEMLIKTTSRTLDGIRPIMIVSCGSRATKSIESGVRGPAAWRSPRRLEWPAPPIQFGSSSSRPGSCNKIEMQNDWPGRRGAARRGASNKPNKPNKRAEPKRCPAATQRGGRAGWAKVASCVMMIVATRLRAARLSGLFAVRPARASI